MPRHREFDPEADAPTRPPRPTLCALTDATYPDIKANYEEAILSGCSKDEAAAFALISYFDHTSFLARVLSEDPDWLNNLTAVGKTNLKATARVHTARRVRAGDAAFVMPIAQATSPDLSPRHESLPQGTTYNIMVFGGDKAATAAPPAIEAEIS
jgi:hypothetical protein